MKKILLMMVTLILTTQAYSETNCWSDENKYHIVDGSFGFVLPLNLKATEKAKNLISSELKITLSLDNVGIIYANASLKKGENRYDMKQRVNRHIINIQKRIPGVDVTCNKFNHPNPVFSGHN